MNTAALITIWNHTQQHPGTSGARACAAVLLGLYDGSRFPMDLTELRSLDADLRFVCLAVIAADARYCKYEVHQWLNTLSGRVDFGDRFEWLATDYKCFKRGAIKLKDIASLGSRPCALVVPLPDIRHGMLAADALGAG